MINPNVSADSRHAVLLLAIELAAVDEMGKAACKAIAVRLPS
jgi:hypothetical protein